MSRPAPSVAAKKRKAPASPHAGGGAAAASASAPLLLDKPLLLSRINEYVFDESVQDLTHEAIIGHLRRAYAEYRGKPADAFADLVTHLCEQEKHKAQQMEQAEREATQSASAPAPAPAPPALASVPSIDRMASLTAQASVHSAASSVATPDGGGREAKRRKVDAAAADATTASGAGVISVSSGGESGESAEESDGGSVVDLDFVETAGRVGSAADEGRNLVNSTMRNLYQRATSLNTVAGGGGGGEEGQAGAAAASASAPPPSASSPYQANPQKARERKPKEKVVYTQNAKKPLSAKKKANRAAGATPVTNVHFQQRAGGPDDAAGAGGGGGDGSNWHPEVLYPTTSYADLGGIEGILQEIHELVEYPLQHPEIYRHLGIQPPRGVLLHGPPGCGKTVLAHAIAGELGVPFMKISAPEVVSGMSGESEQKIRTLFADALEHAPCLLFIDEIDAITPKRATAQREMERRIVAQLLTCMDSLSTSVSGDPSKIVIVIGATNRPDSLDAALRRAGRFDREISLGIPDESARARILQVMCREMKLEPGIDWARIAKAAVGYVGADLMALTREAAVIAINRIFRTVLPTPSLRPVEAKADGMPPPLMLAGASTSPKLGAQRPPIAAAVPNAAAQQLTAALTAQASAAAASGGASTALALPGASLDAPHLLPDSRQARAAAELHSRGRASQKLRAQVSPLTEDQLAPLFIGQSDFDLALKKVQPSSKREGFATIPDVTWNDIGALDELREELSMTILQPILNPQQFEAIGLTVPAGVLLFGPPGCGKTLVAKAIANESGASFLSIKGPELLNQYVGQSERAVRKVFERAKASSPCVIFFDELDALVPKRGSGSSEGNNVSERVVNQLLTEMDGLEERRFVFVIAATNRPDIIDPAMLRPGRLDKLLYVKLPSAPERAAILRKHLRRTPLASDVDVSVVAADPRAEGFSGADVAALVREATLQALREAQARAREEAQARGVKLADMNTWASMKAAAAAAPAAAASPAATSAAGGSSSAVSASSASSAAASAPLPVLVSMSHFHFAFSKVFPSVSAASRAKYDRMHRALCRARATLTNEQPTDAPGGAANGTAGDQPQQQSAAANIEEEDAADRMRTSAPPTPASTSQTPAAPSVRLSPALPPAGTMPPPPPKLPTGASAAAAAAAPAQPAAKPGQATILASIAASQPPGDNQPSNGC